MGSELEGGSSAELPRWSTGDAPEPDPKKALIEGWRPRQLDNGKWGAGLEGPRVAELPKNDRLPGTPIRVTDRTDQSWTTTLTEVVDKNRHHHRGQEFRPAAQLMRPAPSLAGGSTAPPPHSREGG